MCPRSILEQVSSYRLRIRCLILKYTRDRDVPKCKQGSHDRTQLKHQNTGLHMCQRTLPPLRGIYFSHRQVTSDERVSSVARARKVSASHPVSAHWFAIGSGEPTASVWLSGRGRRAWSARGRERVAVETCADDRRAPVSREESSPPRLSRVLQAAQLI